MYTHLKYLDQMLIEVAADAEYLACASEAIPMEHVEGHLYHLSWDTWQTWPWHSCNPQPCWLVAGRFIGQDDTHQVVASGTDFFLFKAQDIVVVEVGPEAAEVPDGVAKALED
jgi:hypothetical protein